MMEAGLNGGIWFGLPLRSEEMVMKVEGYSSRIQESGRWKMHVVSYRLGDRYICTVDNVEPGATLSRAEGATRDEAEKSAIEKAEHMLGKTRVVS